MDGRGLGRVDIESSKDWTLVPGREGAAHSHTHPCTPNKPSALQLEMSNSGAVVTTSPAELSGVTQRNVPVRSGLRSET